MIRTLLVDDEQPARDRLRQLLGAFPDVEVAGEAADGTEALERVAELRPDLVLLDIQMPGCSGLDVVASLPQPRPRIVFCTAFDQYAVDAFELHAVDYLLKPVNRARLAQALERVREASSDADAAVDRAARAIPNRPARFLAKHANRYRVVPDREVLYFASEEGLTKLVTDNSQYWMDPTLADLEARLDPRIFFRISRAAVVNLNALKEIVPIIGGSGEVLLKNGTKLEVSRRRFKDLMDRLQT